MDSLPTIGRAVSIVGTLLLAIALIFGGREHAAIRARAIVSGEVSGVSSQHLTIKFTTQTGELVVFTWNRGDGVGQTAMNVKQAVRVAYDPRNPSDARVLAFGARFGWWFCLGGFGLILVFYRLGSWFGHRWVARHYFINVEPPTDLEAANRRSCREA